jgi:Flp pilus assembly protein CpaB
MKRRTWLWFAASAVLAILAGVLAFTLLPGDDNGAVVAEKQPVVVARNPIAASGVIRVDNVLLEERDQLPSGAAVEVQDVVGGTALRDIAQGEVIKMQDIQIITGTLRSLVEDQLAVALPADDILSKWGVVIIGDHVDLLFTLDVILEQPMYPWDLPTIEDLEFYGVERDQRFDSVTVLTLQNLEVLQIIEEPQAEAQQAAEDQEGTVLRPRALILKVDPQDAVLLKYLMDVGGSIQLALRAPENDALFNVQPVNINYLMLRYGIALPQPLE